MTLEELLNKLIEKGWKPFGWKYYDRFIIESNWDMCFRWKIPWTDWESVFDYNYDYFKIRELVSKESGLWQFCCKNRLTNRDEKADWSKNAERDEDWVIDRDCLIFSSDYEYWIIESALKNESELEKFLLDNIKVS